MTRRSTESGFTLIELLVVISIIALLIGILLPALQAAQRTAHDTICASNQRQIVTMAHAHALDHDGIYTDQENAADDSFNHLYDEYVNDPKIAICPSTENVIRTSESGGPRAPDLVSDGWLRDLGVMADNASDTTGGHSYEIFGFQRAGIYPSGVRVDPPDGQSHQLKNANYIEHPSSVYLLTDGDKGGPNRGMRNNYPDPVNNHGSRGANFGFLDGHTEWAAQGPDYIETQIESGQTPADVWNDVHSTLSQTQEDGLTKWVYNDGGNNGGDPRR